MVSIIEEDPSFQQRLGGALGQAASDLPRFFGQSILQARENSAVNKLTGKDLSGLSPGLRKTFAERLAKTPGHEVIVKALTTKGVSPEDAELYAHLTTGGQTAFVKDLLEAEKRKKKFTIGGSVAGQENQLDGNQQVLSPEQIAENSLQEEVETQDEGLTPSERVKREKERFNTGLKRYEESGVRLRGLARDKERLDIINRLNDSEKLPKGFGRINVKADGTLRAPFLASPEAQQFVKTLNEFSAGAKDTYGSRVTNFDLQQYMLRYPNLLNSKQGRKRVVDQMKLVNQINSIYYKNLKKVYDTAGGVRKIDADKAERFAEQFSEPKIADLSSRFAEIGQFPSLPNPVEFKGRRIKNAQTGEIMISDGENWVPEEK
jgi:hypothetical protein